MSHALNQLWLVRMRTFIREPDAIFWTFIFPILLTIGLGIAFRNKSAEIIHVDVADGAEAELLASYLDDDDVFAVEIVAPEEAYERLRLGKTSIIVKQGDELEYVYDPTRPESRLARVTLDDALQRAMGRADVAETSDTEVTEPGARYIDFLIPGLLGMNLMGGGLWGVGFTITDMRVKKLLKRLVATPMKRSHFMFALIGGRMAFLIPELAMLLGAGWLLFDLRISGGLLSILVISAVGALTFSGLGLLVACRARRIETIVGLTNAVTLPMWLFSGVFFSYEKFPEVFLPFIKLLPLTRLNDALRAVVLEGAGLTDQVVPLLILAAWGGASFLLAMKWFRWT